MRNPLRRIHGNRKPDPRGRPARRINRRIDPNHLATRINQRPARISAIDRRIRLNRLINISRLTGLYRPAQSAHHSRRQSALKSKRVPNRQNFLSHLQVRRIPQRQSHQGFAFRLNLDQRHIVPRIGPNKLRRIPRLVPQNHFDRLRLLHHVKIRQNKSPRIDHKPRPRSFHRHRGHKKVILGSLRQNISHSAGSLPVDFDIDSLIVSQRRIARRHFRHFAGQRQRLDLPRLTFAPPSPSPISPQYQNDRRHTQPHRIRSFTSTHRYSCRGGACPPPLGLPPPQFPPHPPPPPPPATSSTCPRVHSIVPEQSIFSVANFNFSFAGI